MSVYGGMAVKKFLKNLSNNGGGTVAKNKKILSVFSGEFTLLKFLKLSLAKIFQDKNCGKVSSEFSYSMRQK